MQLAASEYLLVLALQRREQILALRVRVVGQRVVIGGLRLYFAGAHFEAFFARIKHEFVVTELGQVVEAVAAVHNHAIGRLFELELGG
ncbi:hypothetical protein BpHYR1_054551 [Brachionus plicatilis]|uniref:Uncharacterized protein n=1 Tax=Brachionus plicatilis TaxID=10195 RepID=A0A3M7SF60_BRAPC|nr:hypothetical protein BpHYR1_054551 [Brachionus plicatilis]